VFDPELPVNIVDLGLIYAIDIDADYNARLKMTLTAPACPVADQIVREVEAKTRATPGVSSARVDLVWSPAWEKSRMSDAALLELGLL
jgi:metal-sulfur cluster biosynthetic enzyme